MRTRPGVVQLLGGNVTSAVEWAGRWVVEQDGRIVVVEGSATTDITSVGWFLRGVNFQALTQNAEREDRFYVADGLRRLWYIAMRGANFVFEPVINSLLDGSNQPYAIPIPTCIETWKGRLFIGYGENRIQHCQYDNPGEWNPLWTLEAQGAQKDSVEAIHGFGDSLIIGLRHATYATQGDSPLNYSKPRIISSVGCAGANSIASDGQEMYRLADKGVFTLSSTDPMSDDIEPLFNSSGVHSSMVFDEARRLLFFVLHGRLFVMHVDTKRCGEITGYHVRGVVKSDTAICFYGNSGLFALGSDDLPDQFLDGTQKDYIWLFDTWSTIPNPSGDGRAYLGESILVCNGSPRSGVTYDVYTDGKQRYSRTVSTSDETQDTWASIATSPGEPYPVPPVRRSFSPEFSGTVFRHVLFGSAYCEIESFTPNYQFGGE
ncbi:MAG: hypothetical protein OEZ43_21035 [Gammaproteobacteria bacterium]|nr:hypothetical protein [Gammaproteobacteria bacterium]